MDTIGAAVWSTGHGGRVIVEAGLTRPWLAFRGGIAHDPAKDGLDLGDACGLGVRLDAPVSNDVDAVLARPDIDVVFYAGLGTPTEVAAACLRANGRARMRSRSRAGPPEDDPRGRPGRRPGRRLAREREAHPRHGFLRLPHGHPAAGVVVERPHL